MEYIYFEYIECLVNIYYIMNEFVKEYYLFDFVLLVVEWIVFFVGLEKKLVCCFL